MPAEIRPKAPWRDAGCGRSARTEGAAKGAAGADVKRLPPPPVPDPMVPTPIMGGGRPGGGGDRTVNAEALLKPNRGPGYDSRACGTKGIWTRAARIQLGRSLSNPRKERGAKRHFAVRLSVRWCSPSAASLQRPRALQRVIDARSLEVPFCSKYTWPVTEPKGALTTSCKKRATGAEGGGFRWAEILL